MRIIITALATLMTGCGTYGLGSFDTGGGASVLFIDPDGDIGFGRVSPSVDKSVLKEVVLHSAGDVPLAIVDVYLDEFSSDAYDVPADLPLPILLAPGGTFPLQVKFKPYAVGEFGGDLLVLIDDGTAEGALIEKPLTGEGCEDLGQTGSCN